MFLLGEDCLFNSANVALKDFLYVQINIIKINKNHSHIINIIVSV